MSSEMFREGRHMQVGSGGGEIWAEREHVRAL